MKAPLETTFQIAILAENPECIFELCEIAPIDWLYCKKTGDHTFEFYNDRKGLSSVDLENAGWDLPNLVGIIVVGSCDAFETVREAWQSRLPSAGIAFRRIEEFNHQAVLGSVIECMAADVARQRLHSGRAALELATYRREFERLQHNFTRLEEYVSVRSFQAPSEIFEYPADPAMAIDKIERAKPGDAEDGSRTTLVQYLPVNSCGVSSFSIYVSAKPETGAGALRISLRAMETGEIFGTWLIQVAEIQLGWVELALSRAIDEPALSLEIIAEWPWETRGWALAFGPPHPYREFCARVPGQEYLEAPFALRVFSSFPGCRVAPTSTAIRPVDASQILHQFVPNDTYGTVVQVVPTVTDSKPALVAYDGGIGCITVHPRKGGVTAARIRLLVPRKAWGVSAEIHLAHELASPTEFGLMIGAPGDEPGDMARVAALDVPSPRFSGWKRLMPLERKSISVAIAALYKGQLAVYLLTRQAPDSSPDFGWARFSKFEFNILPNCVDPTDDDNKNNALIPSLGEIA